MKCATRYLWTGVLVTAVLFLAIYAFGYWLVPGAARWLDVGVPPRAVDAVAVLPGDENTRPFVAAALLNAGLAKKALIPENLVSNDVEDGIRPPTHEIIRRVLVLRGVPQDRIQVLSASTQSTSDDCDIFKQYLSTHDTARIALVTSSYHTRRTRLTVQTRLTEHATRIDIISAPNPSFEADSWWSTEDGFNAVTSEYVKLAAYWMLYGRGVYWLLGVVGALVSAVLIRRAARSGHGPCQA